MKKLLFGAIITVFTLGFVALAIKAPYVYAAQPTVDLGTATPFAILAGTPAITDAGNTSVITGNVGLSPRTSADIGLWCSQMTGLSTIYGVDAGYTGGGHGTLCFKGTAPDKTLVDKAQVDLTTAYTDAANRTPVTTVGTELGGTTKFAGVYTSGATAFQITAGAGPLVLDAQGDPSAVFIFEVPADEPGLTVGNASEVQLTGQAQACNVFWRVISASIGTTAVFKGNILALNSITVANGANIEGSLLARNGQVTLINDTITVPVCKTTTVTPKLPNTGSASLENSQTLLAISLAAVAALVALASFIIVRTKRAN